MTALRTEINTKAPPMNDDTITNTRHAVHGRVNVFDVTTRLSDIASDRPELTTHWRQHAEPCPTCGSVHHYENSAFVMPVNICINCETIRILPDAHGQLHYLHKDHIIHIVYALRHINLLVSYPMGY